MLLAAGCPLDQGEPYGNCLTYGPGHYETWAHWRRDRTVDPGDAPQSGGAPQLVRISIEARLHGLKDDFVLPTRDPALLASCALIL
jgi:hypothetical protein